jgi:hypothetical protein
MPGWLTLMGSGETAAGMAKVHRSLFDGLAEAPRPAFLDTPAGFELGVEAIATRFVDYFAQRFDLPVALAAHHQADEDPETQARALAAIAQSNYILAGPGSPTYAARQWMRSPIFQAVGERWRAGAQLVFASSAAIAISRYVLPVYEIYKVGQELHWSEGLDLLGPLGFELAIVSHWDNAEGGTHDTSACFMGRERFGRLRSMLPPSAVVLGVDEHTACTLDLEAGNGWVQGRSSMTILRGQETHRHKAGERFSLEELRSPGAERGAGTWVEAEMVRGGSGQDQSAAVAQAAVSIAGGDLAGGLRQVSEAAGPELAAVLHQAAQAIETASLCDETEAALVDLLIEARASLRSAKEWRLADRVRDRLAELGYELRDGTDGTSREKRA